MARTRRAIDVLGIASLLVVAALSVNMVRAGDAATATTELHVRVGWEIENRRAFGARQLPLWNPYYFGGQPHFENTETLALYPPHVVLRLFPIAAFVRLTLVLHLWMIGAGVYLIARALRAPVLGAVAAGAAAMLGTPPTPSGAWPHTLYAVAWVPLAIAGAMRAVERPGRPGILLVLAIAGACLTASALAVAFVIAAAAAVYAFGALAPQAALRRPTSLVRQFGVTCALAVGLTAFQTLPAYGLWRSVRAGELAYAASAERSDRPGDSGALSSGAAAPLRQSIGRTIVGCAAAADPGQLMTGGVPTVDGYGVYTRGYARMTALAAGSPAADDGDYPRFSNSGRPGARTDLTDLFAAEYLLSCDTADAAGWVRVADAGGSAVYRRAAPPPRAQWTCAPSPVTRAELEGRLSTLRYDSQLQLRQPRDVVNVRWAPDVDAARRAQSELSFRLTPLRFVGERTWQYELGDSSPDMVAAIVRSTLVEDTAGLDRERLVVARRTPRADQGSRSEWLVGAGACPTAAPVRLQQVDRHDGSMTMSVDAPDAGIVFVSDTYYPGRKAWVDGREAPVLRVNLAFTGIPVAAGRHRVELSYFPRTVMAGAAVTALTLALWIGLARRTSGGGRETVKVKVV